MLATWLSFADLVRLCEAAVTAPRSGHCVIWACSNNPVSFWGRDHRDRIGWQPQDTAEAYPQKVGHITSGNPVTERYQGGGYTAIDYSRSKPSAPDAFDLD